MKLLIITTTFLVLCFLSCDPGNDDDKPLEPEETQNNAPNAQVSGDDKVKIGSVVKLDASSSTDADGDSLTYKWSFLSIPDGSAASITGVEQEQAEFTLDKVGKYEIELTVNDGTATNKAVYTVLIKHLL